MDRTRQQLSAPLVAGTSERDCTPAPPAAVIATSLNAESSWGLASRLPTASRALQGSPGWLRVQWAAAARAGLWPTAACAAQQGCPALHSTSETQFRQSAVPRTAVLCTTHELNQASAVLAYAGCKLHVCDCVLVSAPESRAWRHLGKHLDQRVVHLLGCARETPAELRKRSQGCCRCPCHPADLGCDVTAVLQLLACTGCTCSN